MQTRIPMTDNPNNARRHEYRTPWITSQSGVPANTNRRVAENEKWKIESEKWIVKNEKWKMKSEKLKMKKKKNEKNENDQWKKNFVPSFVSKTRSPRQGPSDV